LKKNYYLSVLFAAVAVCFAACDSAKPATGSATKAVGKATAMKVPDWAKSATIYEMNIRQFSKQGTLKEATEGLSGIKDMGMDIVWLMPIYPISEKNRKCNDTEKTECWGSHYAATSFTEIDPRYGTKDDFRNFMKTAHGLGLKVILDMVPDHTGWDSKWITAHPEYYVKIDGKISTPIDPKSKKPTDWYDVAMLDYSNKALRKEMIDAHTYWLKEFDIDGYREDVAGFVPDDFWAELRPHLDKVKPVFMLAEWEDETTGHLSTCYQMVYGWNFHFLMKEIFKGKKNANDIEAYLKDHKTKFPKQGYHMHFTQNHDENTWNGTEKESFGDSGDCFTALCFTFDGMGEMYNGQEVSLNKRLSFFHKDYIPWDEGASRREFFTALSSLKHRNQAIWNGEAGGELKRIVTNNQESVFAFTREKNGDKVLCIFNLSPKEQKIGLKGDFNGAYKNAMTMSSYEIGSGSIVLPPWGYLVLSNK
jgi:alpha-amylase